jgi:hypothetical protein
VLVGAVVWVAIAAIVALLAVAWLATPSPCGPGYVAVRTYPWGYACVAARP